MNAIGTAGYGAAALAFAAFTLVMLTGWRGRLHGALLAAAGMATCVWAAAAAYNAARGYVISAAVPLAEVLRDGLWFAFLLRLLLPSFAWRHLTADWKTGTTVAVAAACGLMLVAASAAPLLGPAAVAPAVGAGTEIMGFLVLAITGLVWVEQVYRNTVSEKRWAIKFLCVGVGGMFAFDFFLYADAMLFKRIDVNWWTARGFIDAFVVPLIAVAAARNPEWSLDVYVSRSVVFHTTTLLVAGGCLLVMAAGGYYIRLYGGDWGEVLEAIFLFSALTGLVLFLFSGRAKAHLKVLLSKHFFNYRYDYREEWLRFIRTLSAPVNQNAVQFRELTIRSVGQIVDSRGGWLWFRDETGQYDNTANWNAPPMIGRVAREDDSLVRFLSRTEWVVDIDHYRRDPHDYQDLELPPWLFDLPRPWLIVPLMQHERLMGFMVLMQPQVPRRIDWEDCDLLKTVGRQVASYLGQLQASEALSDAKQFETYNRFSAYLIHDLKNLVAQLSLVVSNAAKHKHNPEFMEDAIQTVDHCVQSMKHLLGQLRSGRGAAGAPMEKTVSLGQVLGGIIGRMGSRRPVPVLAHDAGLYVRADPQRLGAVAGHIIQNAQEATPPDGRVEVRVYADDRFAVIEVADTGCGMDARFIRDRLFRPFDTTKGKTGMGIGVYETREWVREQGGEVEVRSEPGKGTVFKLKLPHADAPVPAAAPDAPPARTTA